MNKLTTFIEEKFAPLFSKLAGNPYVNGLKDGMVATAPFTIIGSLFIIIQQFPVKAWLEFISPYSAMFAVPNMMTIGIIALYVSFSVGYNMGKSFNVDPLFSGLLSLLGFMMLQINPEDYSMVTSYFGSKGIFPAIMVAIFAVKTLEFFEKRGWVIKFPEGVPSAVSKSFAALYPAMFITFILFIVSVVLKLQIQEMIIMLFSPLVFALNTLPGILVYMLCAQLLWASGIHGMSVMNAVGTPIFLSYITANSEAALAGQPIPYITATGFIQFFISIGGTGATLALVLSMIRSKEEGFKTLGKLALPAGIFNINEPIIFGFPIVLNPTMMIPFIIVPLLNATMSYGLMYFNIIGRPIANVPWIMPGPIGAYLSTGGDWVAAVWVCVELAIATAIYYPFFKVSEKQRLQEENII